MGQKVILDPGISDRLLYSARWLIWSYTNLLLHNLGLWAPSWGAGNGSVWSCQAQDPGIWGKLLGTQVPWNQSASVQTNPVGQVWHMTGHLLSSHLAFQFPAGPGTWPQTTAAWLGAWQLTNALLELSLLSGGAGACHPSPPWDAVRGPASSMTPHTDPAAMRTLTSCGCFSLQRF